MIKEFILEHESSFKPMIFFTITLGIFVLATVHAIKLNKKKVDDMANLALNSDDE